MSKTALDVAKTRIAPGFLASYCIDNGCSLDLTGMLDPFALVRVDSNRFRLQNPLWRFPNGQRRCDFLLVAGEDAHAGPWVVPIELTIGRKAARDFKKQIEGGLLVADELLPDNISFRFKPVGGCRFSVLDRAVTNELRRECNRVSFRGKDMNIHLVECESPLVDALVE